MTRHNSKKKLTRGEKWLLVAPLFVLLAWAWQERSSFLMRWFVRDAIIINDEVAWVRATPNGKKILISALRYDSSTETSSSPFALWDVKTRKVLWKVPFSIRMRRLSFSPDGRKFLLVSTTSLPPTQNFLELRDTASGQPVWTTPIAGRISNVAFTPDAKSIVAQNKLLEIYDATTGALQRTLPIAEAIYSSQFRLSHDGLLITKKTLPQRFYIVLNEL